MADKSKIAKSKRTPKYSSRKVNRCSICGRPRGFIRFFGLCRLCFRQRALKGLLPGVKRASW